MNKNNLLILVIASIASIAVSFFPAISFLIFPIELFGTFVHELCHALVAILTGGHAYSIAINPDTSGLTVTSGGIQWLISFAGYIGTVLVGLFSIFLLSRDKVKVTLIMFFCIVLSTSWLTATESFYGTVWGLSFALCFYLLGSLRVNRSILNFLISFISIQLLLNAFYDLKVLFNLSGTGVTTDAQNMQNSTGIPAVFWASAWILFSVYATYRASRIILKRKQA